MMFKSSRSRSFKGLSGYVTRRRFVAALGLAGAGLFGGTWYTRFFAPHNLQRDRRDIPVLKSGSKPVRIVHLSDFHASPEVSYDYLESAVELAVGERPDVFCLTGDYITRGINDFGRYVSILSKLSAVAPVYAVTGNHDVFGGINEETGRRVSVRDLLRESGITHLHNRLEEVVIQGNRLNLVGLGDYWSYQCMPERVFPIVGNTDPTVVLSHNPDSKSRMEGYEWDLMLCGHTHGGQFKVPLLGLTPFAPVKDHDFVSGLNRWQGHYIYTTHGLGNLYGVRFNSPPQLSVLELVAKKS